MSCTTGSSVCREVRQESIGVPMRCWCGRKVDLLVSKTNENPYRRFYRCQGVLQRKYESHLFKWVEVAMPEEFEEQRVEIGKAFSELERMAWEFSGLGRSLKSEMGKLEARVCQLENDVKVREAEACRNTQRGVVGVAPHLVLAVCVAGGLALVYKALCG
ncbi:hypothetical protein F2Q68_00011725 [Brassica cretica]|uniref:GRF-type domain-containing protein n=1 Tax=Brassica cretica TaxID=69181 RepID=A0A8S9KWN2_BRACR|nr:hypothetical protein F2Q68_00011725 [Brassica cretica]